MPRHYDAEEICLRLTHGRYSRRSPDYFISFNNRARFSPREQAFIFHSIAYLCRTAEETEVSFAVFKGGIASEYWREGVLRQVCRYIHWRHDRNVGGDEGAHWDRVVNWDPRMAARVERCEARGYH